MSDVLFSLNLEEEDIMKKFGYIIAALASLAIAAPSIASAQSVVIKSGGHHERDGYRGHGGGSKVVIKRGGYRDGARAEYRGRSHRDHGWHRGHDKKVVIIKHGRDRRY
jgi:hypothetical protein